MPHPTPSRKLPFILVLILSVLVAIEGVSYLGVSLLKRKLIYYEPYVVGKKEYEEYLNLRDPILGWPAPSRFDGKYYDSTGSRVVPAYPDPARNKTYVSLYGDSMTESLEVDSAKAWSNVLSMLIGARVANFGGAGYGTDQALLRFIHNTRDEAKVVFFNLFSENILRNVNQYRFLLANDAGHALGFKPRFILDGDGLALVPMPTFTYDEYVACCISPGKFLPHEFYLPDNGVSGIQTASFPFALTLFRTFNNHIVNPKLRQVPRHIDFYRDDHPGRSLAITARILKMFHKEAIARGKIPIITVIPDGKDLEYFLRNGSWTYQSLTDSMKSANVGLTDFGPLIVAKLQGRDPCEIINDCYNHFNEEGYRIVATISYEILKGKGLLPVPEPR